MAKKPAAKQSEPKAIGYWAEQDHEIETATGTVRVEAGYYVAETPDGLRCMPPEIARVYLGE